MDIKIYNMDIKIYIILDQSSIREFSPIYLLSIHCAAYVPKTTHIVTITFEPSVISQRKAIQCGAEVIKGDSNNPIIVNGIQYIGYK